MLKQNCEKQLNFLLKAVKYWCKIVKSSRKERYKKEKKKKKE